MDDPALGEGQAYARNRTRLSMAGLLLAAAAMKAAADSTTLTTYYPAPSGVYTKMLTTDQTWLARDANSVVIGGVAVPGAGTKLSVMGGNVGIGTLSPGAALNVPGGAVFGGTGGSPGAEPIASVGAGSGLSLADRIAGPRWVAYPTSGNLRFWNSGNGDLMTIAGNGNVGIGNMAPLSALDVRGFGAGNVDLTVNGRLKTGDATNSGGIWLSNNGDMFLGQNGNKMGFWTAGEGWNAMTIQQDGSIGIGTQNPVMIHPGQNDRVLDVKGDICAWNWWGHRICIGGDNFGNDVEVDLYDNPASPSNRIGFYNQRQGQHADLYAKSYNTISSQRFKENIRPIERPLELVRRLQGVRFDWKTDKEPSIGLIAEDVAKVMPEVVSYDFETGKPRGLDYTRLIPVLIEAVKLQQSEIEELKRTLASKTAASEPKTPRSTTP